MKQQTRVGKILESLNKRRRVFSEAWGISLIIYVIRNTLRTS